MLSAKSSPRDKERAARLGADRYVTRPFALRDVVEAMTGFEGRGACTDAERRAGGEQQGVSVGIGGGDLDHAIGLMNKHRALEDTINRAQHYGAMAVDALALFPASTMKSALEQVVAFCLARSH